MVFWLRSIHMAVREARRRRRQREMAMVTSVTGIPIQVFWLQCVAAHETSMVQTYRGCKASRRNMTPPTSSLSTTTSCPNKNEMCSLACHLASQAVACLSHNYTQISMTTSIYYFLNCWSVGVCNLRGGWSFIIELV
mmetsp:Transcript_10850/g.19723  ORF Transcript_10850/g.19723 Transcript_10850/m.19723 type:complete len:137 (-) Transcript_10850:80-490(-)